MSQLAASEGQPGNWEEPNFLMRRLETVRDQEYGWQEPDESRGSRPDLWETGGEIPPVHPTVKDDVKTGGFLYTRINPGETCLLPGWRPA
jgi:hypothetical protein